jgi:GNAT superfamily N-acetyltransferase
VDLPATDRIDAAGNPIPIEVEPALREGEALHRAFRPKIVGDYIDYLARMGREGAGVMQLFDDGEVRAIAVWRTYLTTYSGRRFEIDDLVTADGHRSKGYGRTLMAALDAKARALACDAVTLTSATWRTDAHRFYFRERFTIASFFFTRPLD